MKALLFDRFGGPEVLRYGEVADPELPAGHAMVRLQAIGLNFADIYRRRGNYHLEGPPPYIAGYEGAGVIEALAPDVADLRVGQRVGFADAPFANAERTAIASDRIIPLPDDVDSETAAALLLQGLTAHYLTHDSHRIAPAEAVAIHAAAGGVGLLLTQIAKILGARVLGLASSEPQREAARMAGADAVAPYDSWVEAARRFARNGSGVDVVYDSLGVTLRESLAAARTGGQVVFYGMAGGDPPPIDPRLLMDESKTLTGGDLWNVLGSREERVRRATELFGWLREGRLQARVAARFALAEGAAAHTFLESRGAIGKVLLIP